MPHIHEKIDFCAEVFIVFEDKVLLRKHDKYKIWLSVGGHIELDEDPNQAAVREVKEEVGLDIELFVPSHLEDFVGTDSGDLIPPFFLNRHKISETHEHIALIYVASTKSDKLELCEVEKSAGCKWFTRAELDDVSYAITPTVKRYAQEALRVFGHK